MVKRDGSRWTRNPYVLMPLLLLAWGSFAATNKLLLASMDSYLVLFYMYGFALIVFLAILMVQGKLKGFGSWNGRDFGLLAGCGTLAFLYDFLYLQALERLPAVEASMLNYLFPIFIVLFAIPIHRERFTWNKALSLALGLLGSVLLITKGDWASFTFTNAVGDVLAIFAAVCWGLFTNLVKMNERDAALSNLFITFVAFVWTAGAMWGNSSLSVPSLPNLGGLVWLAVGNIVLGFLLYFQALKHASASLVASFTFFTPCVTLLFILVMVGERLSWIDLGAFLLIFISVPIQQGLPLPRLLPERRVPRNGK
ncbi:DMT family transporter [Paenibacillus sp. HJGM_3]|uniref:DMT family transporter n=1 Tax=Paenibacillus sp. HJGM_3 TaxID=3379816 RepID=UPI00385A43F9